MLLGNRGFPALLRVGRCLVVWTAFDLAIGAVGWLVRDRAAQAWSDRGAIAHLPLDQALTDASAVVLVACAGWAWVAFTVTVAEAVLVVTNAGRTVATRVAGDPGHRPWGLPVGLRRLVLAGCGVALAAGLAQPALAAEHGPAHPRGPSVLVGLPLPERPVAPAGSARSADPRTVAARTAVARTVVVRPGDCLWSIAARELPPDTSARAVTERWRAIYAANRNVIGPDPDRLVAGLRLVVPPDPVSSVHRKDRS